MGEIFFRNFSGGNKKRRDSMFCGRLVEDVVETGQFFPFELQK